MKIMNFKIIKLLIKLTKSGFASLINAILYVENIQEGWFNNLYNYFILKVWKI